MKTFKAVLHQDLYNIVCIHDLSFCATCNSVNEILINESLCRGWIADGSNIKLEKLNFDHVTGETFYGALSIYVYFSSFLVQTLFDVYCSLSIFWFERITPFSLMFS